MILAKNRVVRISVNVFRKKMQLPGQESCVEGLQGGNLVTLSPNIRCSEKTGNNQEINDMSGIHTTNL